MKERRAKNVIHDIHRKGGIFTNDKKETAKELVDFFKSLSDESGKSLNEIEIEKIINYKLPPNQSMKFVEEIKEKKIKDMLVAMNNNKAFGLGSFKALFFKVAWDIISKNFIKVIKHFFNSRNLFREVNCTSLALILKCFNASYCKDFKPIAYYNVIYNCIIKIMAHHLKCLLPNFINIG